MTEIQVDGLGHFDKPEQKIDIRRTGETMQVTGMRRGRGRDVWRVPVAWEWRLRWGIVPWYTAFVWTFGGTVEDVPVKPHPKAERRFEYEEFMTVKRGGW